MTPLCLIGALAELPEQESVAAAKERWQLDTIRNREALPSPLKACPRHLRATA